MTFEKSAEGNPRGVENGDLKKSSGAVPPLDRDNTAATITGIGTRTYNEAT